MYVHIYVHLDNSQVPNRITSKGQSTLGASRNKGAEQAGIPRYLFYLEKLSSDHSTSLWPWNTDAINMPNSHISFL